MDKQTGGSAFPDFKQEGMTLRDYFAAKAMPALIEQGIVSEHIAKEAYRFADLMLVERAK